jgi:hypothetical protein
MGAGIGTSLKNMGPAGDSCEPSREAPLFGDLQVDLSGCLDIGNGTEFLHFQLTVRAINSTV